MSGFGENVGISASAGAMLVSSIMISNICSKFIMGFLCRSLGDIKTSMILGLISLAGLLILLMGGRSVVLQ